MCTGLELGPALIGASTGMQAFGAYTSSRAAKAAYGAQAQVARNNAQVAEWQAGDALRRGDKAASRVRMQAHQLAGQQRAAFAANGVDVTVGSPLQILSDTEYFGEIDALTAKDNASKEAWALKNQANGFTSDAALLQSRAATESPLLAVSSSLLTGASRVASRWYAPPGRKGVPDYLGADY